MKGYIIVKNDCGCEIGKYEVDTDKAIAGELIRVINEQRLVFYEGDTIEFRSEYSRARIDGGEIPQS